MSERLLADEGRPAGERTTLLLCGLIVAVAALVYLARWRTIESFTWWVDPRGVYVEEGRATVFCDFTRHFYPQGQLMRGPAQRVRGFYYSPTFGLAMSLFAGLDLATARGLWVFLVVAATAGTWALALGDLFRSSRAGALLFTLLSVTSLPALHNFNWGQVSALVTFMVVGALLLVGRGRSGLGGALLGAAACLKYYPAVFALWPLLRRDRAALAGFAGALLGLGVALPCALLGCQATVDLYELSYRATSSFVSVVARTPYPQYWPNVVSAHLGGGIDPASGRYRALRASGYLVAGANVALLAVLVRRRVAHEPYWAATLLFTALPFVVGTSWVHYFMYLPLVHAFAWLLLREAALPAGTVAVLGGSLLAPSALLASVLFFALYPSAELFYESGFLGIANALALLLAWVLGVRLARAAQPASEP